MLQRVKQFLVCSYEQMPNIIVEKGLKMLSDILSRLEKFINEPTAENYKNAFFHVNVSTDLEGSTLMINN